MRACRCCAIFIGIVAFVIQRMLPVTEGVKFGAMTHGNPQEIGTQPVPNLPAAL